MVAETIRQTLDTLPPFVEMPTIAGYASMAGTVVANSPICEWTDRDKKPVIEWVQAEMEGLAWKFKTTEGFIPDIAIKADAGASAGAAVANGTASAGAQARPTDTVKIALKIATAVPEAINMTIKLNMARAKLACAGANLAAG